MKFAERRGDRKEADSSSKCGIGTRGLIPVIEAADIMAKAAGVRLIARQFIAVRAIARMHPEVKGILPTAL